MFGFQLSVKQIRNKLVEPIIDIIVAKCVDSDINSRDYNNNTLLHYASKSGNWAVVEALRKRNNIDMNVSKYMLCLTKYSKL